MKPSELENNAIRNPSIYPYINIYLKDIH